MTIPQRELSITYGGFTVGGGYTARILRDIHGSGDDYEKSYVEYRFTLVQDTEANLASEIGSAEYAFRTPHQDFVVRQGTRDLKNFSQAANTGFDAVPTVVKRGEPTDTGRSRTYTVRIDFTRPADTSSSLGRRVTRTGINVAFSPARRRTVTITGEYTALGVATARGNYRSVIDAYASSVLSDIGGTYKRMEEPVTEANDTNKTLRFTDTYQEVILTGVGSGNANVRREVLRISRAKVGPGDTADQGVVERLITLNVGYECYLNRENDTSLRALYDTLRSSILDRVLTTANGRSVALVEEVPDFDDTDNRLSVRMVCLAAGNTAVLERTVTTELSDQFGVVLVPAWTGDAYSRYIYEGPRTTRLTRTVHQRTLGTQGGGGGERIGLGVGGGGDFGAVLPGIGRGAGANLVFEGGGRVPFGIGGAGDLGAILPGIGQGGQINLVFPGGGGIALGAVGGGDQGGFIPVSHTQSDTPRKLGIGGNTLDVVDSMTVDVFEKATPIQGGGRPIQRGGSVGTPTQSARSG